MVDCITVDIHINAMSITCIHNPLEYMTIYRGGGGYFVFKAENPQNKRSWQLHARVLKHGPLQSGIDLSDATYDDSV